MEATRLPRDPRSWLAGVAARAAATMRSIRGVANGRSVFAVMSITPAYLWMTAYLLIPTVMVLWLSFYSWEGLGPVTDFVGLRNYARLLSRPEFVDSVRITLVYTLAGGAATVAAGFVLALIVSSHLRGWQFYRIAWFIPVLLPGAVVALLWVSGVFTPTTGVADAVAQRVGLHSPDRGWLGEPSFALPAVIVTSVWAFSGWPMLLLAAGLERIPKELYEAASLDGAGTLDKTRYITLPLIKPVLGAVSALQLIAGLKGFDIVYVMTGGGPGGATRTMSLFLYDAAFTAGNFGTASAVATVMILVILPFALLSRRWLNF